MALVSLVLLNVVLMILLGQINDVCVLGWSWCIGFIIARYPPGPRGGFLPHPFILLLVLNVFVLTAYWLGKRKMK
jgi:hypothetical protein